MLEAANWAPTHKMTEPWRFAVFEDEESRRVVGLHNQEFYKKNCPVEKFSQKKYEKKLISALSSSYIIAICMKRDSKERIDEWEEIAAVACAVQNMHLYLSAIGIGAYWSSGGLSCSTEVKSGLLSKLKLEEPDKVLGFFYVGVPGGATAKRWPTKTRNTSGLEKVTWLSGKKLSVEDISGIKIMN
eukprot:g2323.t1